MYLPISSVLIESTVVMVTCVFFLLLFVVAGVRGIIKQHKNKTL